MKLRKSVSRPGQERGNITLEAAIVFPVLLLITAGIIDLGRLFYEKSVLTNAVREGARAASRVSTTDGVSAEYTKSYIMTTVVKAYLNSYNIKDASGNPISLTLGSNFTYTIDTSVTPNRLTLSLVSIPVKMMMLPNIQTFLNTGQINSIINLNAQVTMAAEWTNPPS